MTRSISMLRRLRNAGPRMAVDFLRILPYRWKIRRLIRRTSRVPHAPLKGITVIGPFTRSASSSKVLRDFVRSLKLAAIPCQTLDTDPRCQISQEDVDGLLTPIAEFDVCKYDHIVELLSSVAPDIPGVTKARIAFWEFADGFAEGRPDLLSVRHVIAMSDFCEEFFRRELPSGTKVSKLLYPFIFNPGDIPDRDEIRLKFGLGKDDFVVFFNFDYGSGFMRKNPDGAMRAFAKAFGSSAHVKLVFKTMGAKTHADRADSLKRLAHELGINDRFVTIDTYVLERELYGLTKACDVYLSLHRGEGFGLTLAEAMAMGKPVVCTDWSSTTEFCKPDCTMPVSYKLVKPCTMDEPCYKGVTQWAEADVDDAARKLRELYDNPRLRVEIGLKAKTSIAERFSLDNYRQSVMAFLNS